MLLFVMLAMLTAVQFDLSQVKDDRDPLQDRRRGYCSCLTNWLSDYAASMKALKT